MDLEIENKCQIYKLHQCKTHLSSSLIRSISGISSRCWDLHLNSNTFSLWYWCIPKSWCDKCVLDTRLFIDRLSWAKLSEMAHWMLLKFYHHHENNTTFYCKFKIGMKTDDCYENSSLWWTSSLYWYFIFVMIFNLCDKKIHHCDENSLFWKIFIIALICHHCIVIQIYYYHENTKVFKICNWVESVSLRWIFGIARNIFWDENSLLWWKIIIVMRVYHYDEHFHRDENTSY